MVIVTKIVALKVALYVAVFQVKYQQLAIALVHQLGKGGVRTGFNVAKQNGLGSKKY